MAQFTTCLALIHYNLSIAEKSSQLASALNKISNINFYSELWYFSCDYKYGFLNIRHF